MVVKVRLSPASLHVTPPRLGVRAGVCVSPSQLQPRYKFLAFSGFSPLAPSCIPALCAVPCFLPTFDRPFLSLLPCPYAPHLPLVASASKPCNSTCVFSLQFGNEEQQLAWAKRESEKAEQERLARLRRQEQEDLELAIALSKADMPA